MLFFIVPITRSKTSRLAKCLAIVAAPKACRKKFYMPEGFRVLAKGPPIEFEDCLGRIFAIEVV
jgi:hypothetical protein